MRHKKKVDSHFGKCRGCHDRIPKIYLINGSGRVVIARCKETANLFRPQNYIKMKNFILMF